MAILLDTQIIIWLETEYQKISSIAIEKIKSEEHVFITTVSVWKIAIKLKLEKLQLKNTLEFYIAQLQKDYKFKLLDIKLPHIYNLQNLPLIHKDPFDRLIASQSMIENIPLISSDKIFDDYNIQRIW